MPKSVASLSAAMWAGASSGSTRWSTLPHFTPRKGEAMASRTATTATITTIGRRITAWASRGPPAVHVVHDHRTVPAPRQPAAVDLAAEQAEHGRQHGERGQHRDHDRGDAAVAHAAQERLREDQQAGQGCGNGEPGEQDGAARGDHGPLDRGGRRLRIVIGQGRHLFAEPTDHEERVVDREADPQQRDHVDGEDRDLGELGDHPDQRQAHRSWRSARPSPASRPRPGCRRSGTPAGSPSAWRSARPARGPRR